jgi:hypothetical protein
MMQKLNINVEEFLAWARGTPVKVAVPPPPNRATKIWSITVPPSTVVVIPSAMFSSTEANASVHNCEEP